MQNPVAMPRGGMSILRLVTALRPSRMRQIMTPQKPMIAPKADIAGVRIIIKILPYRAATRQFAAETGYAGLDGNARSVSFLTSRKFAEDAPVWRPRGGAVALSGRHAN